MQKQHAKPMRRRAASGFTLIELLVVIVILAILAAVVITKVTHRVDDARESKAISDVKSLSSALEMYQLDIGNYPSSDQGLNALVQNMDNNPKWKKPYIGGLPSDPWQHPYIYKFPGDHGEVDVFSAGPDGQPGTGDDIGNWIK
jgi:general secretion pathway protein G